MKDLKHIKRFNESDENYWEFLVKFYTKRNKTQIQDYFNRNTLASENYQVL
jgi:hypothetical protein